MALKNEMSLVCFVPRVFMSSSGVEMRAKLSNYGKSKLKYAARVWFFFFVFFKYLPKP